MNERDQGIHRRHDAARALTVLARCPPNEHVQLRRVQPDGWPQRKGERFPDDTTKAASTPYAQAITRTRINGMTTVEVVIESPFAPEKVVVDPDVRVLQLRRASAERKLGS